MTRTPSARLTLFNKALDGVRARIAVHPFNSEDRCFHPVLPSIPNPGRLRRGGTSKVKRSRGGCFPTPLAGSPPPPGFHRRPKLEGMLAAECPLWVERGKAQMEQMLSALRPKADIDRRNGHVRSMQLAGRTTGIENAPVAMVRALDEVEAAFAAIHDTTKTHRSTGQRAESRRWRFRGCTSP